MQRLTSMRTIGAMLMAGAALAGCTPPDTRPAVSAKAPADLGLVDASAPTVDAQWWRALGDRQLDRVLAEALAGNPTLDAAAARVRQAQAALASRRAENGPNVAFDANGMEQRLSGTYIYPPPYGGTVRFLGNVQAGLEWNLDLFGRQKAAIEGARASTRAAALDADAARLMLQGAIVSTYLEVVRAERQAALAERTIAARNQSLKLIDMRIRSNLASKLDREAANTLLAQAGLALTRAHAARALAVNALAALAGRGADYPATIGATSVAADAGLPLPATIPADLLARRADIAAAQARIAAAAAGRQVARRAFYPNVNISALAGLQALGLGNMFDTNSGVAGGGAAIHLPIFDNGRLKADLANATAGLDLAVADYNAKVVGAVREAADAVAKIRAADAERARQGDVVRGYAETARLNGIRVSSGLASRLDLIDTDVRLLDAQLAETNLAIDALAARAQLAEALGGGFDPSRNIQQ